MTLAASVPHRNLGSLIAETVDLLQQLSQLCNPESAADRTEARCEDSLNSDYLALTSFFTSSIIASSEGLS